MYIAIPRLSHSYPSVSVIPARGSVPSGFSVRSRMRRDRSSDRIQTRSGYGSGKGRTDEGPSSGVPLRCPMTVIALGFGEGLPYRRQGLDRQCNS
jgi:hypothetical protein